MNDGSRLHLARYISLGHSECSSTCDRAERRCGCPGGRPHTVACEPLREAMTRSGRLSIRQAMLDVYGVPTLYDEYIAMAKTGNECQLSAYMLLLR